MTEFKNPMSLKAHIKNEALKKNIPAQVIMQNYMMERILERISLSKYKNNFILKGGFLISSIVGIDTRNTMDIDTTLKGITLGKDNIHKIFEEITAIPLSDHITFNIKRMEEIREGDKYPGIRIFLEALYSPLKVPLSIDITTGDKIIPKEIKYSFPLMFENREIVIYAYNLETILAEKLESILSRKVFNTRMKDFYDVYLLYGLFENNINLERLKNSLVSTFERRKSTESLAEWEDTILKIRNNKNILNLWESYKKDFGGASEMEIDDVCNTIMNLLKKLKINI